MIQPGCTSKSQTMDVCINKSFKAVVQKFLVKYVSEMINKEHVQLPPPSRQDMVDWLEKAFNYISNDTQMVSRSFDVCGITTTDFTMVRSGSFYKSCMENASKHLQNDEGEGDLFVLWFYTVTSLGSLKKKEKQKLKKCLFVFEWLKICNPHYN